MENSYQGDLADVFRGSRHGATAGDLIPAPPDWQLPSMDYPSETFGHPFNNFPDPLLDDLDVVGSAFFSGSTLSSAYRGDDPKKPQNIFSRLLQISPNSNKFPLTAPPDPGEAPSKGGGQVANEVITVNNGNSSAKACLLENPGLQISSPRNAGIKRRKSQAKKVVCIPAPAPANSRPTGEVVPSDLWAWRKYGQKPIKGSPYPRGYYRCSSSKGCSARKQVERSRTDPNMLVITYTSEHNHPWPTQRNALAGSTRSQPSKTPSSKTSGAPPQAPFKRNAIEQESKDPNAETVAKPPPLQADASKTSKVKEEENERELDDDKEMKMVYYAGGGIGDGFCSSQSYRPVLPQPNMVSNSNHHEDFFAELGELEGDPLNLLFGQGFSGDDKEREGNGKAAMDHFSFYDWAASATHSSLNNSTTFGDEKRGL